MSTSGLILLLLPLIVVELLLMAYALIDLVRRKRVRFGSKLPWAIIIIFINLVGPIIYLAWGREPETSDASEN